MPKDEEIIDYTIKGNFLTGVTVYSSKGESVVLAKNSWYDWLFFGLAIAGLVFGVALCGAIGAALSCLFCLSAALINATISRSKLNIVLKILSEIVVLILANAIWFGLYCMFVLLIFS